MEDSWVTFIGIFLNDMKTCLSYSLQSMFDPHCFSVLDGRAGRQALKQAAESEPERREQ